MHRILKGFTKTRDATRFFAGFLWFSSPTILGDTGCTTAGLVHPYEIRKLSIAKIKALASYPEEFQFVGSYRARWARVGNSVPPLFMKAIAEHIRYRLLFVKKSAAQ
jgi:DNA (cytosine-5)-methyltransferase 1